MLSFRFLEKDSYDDFDIIVNQIPNIPMPQRSVEYVNIPGMSGSYTVDNGTYNDITISLSCTVISNNLVESVSKIKAWLSGGQGKLYLSTEPDKYYIAQVVNKFDIIEAMDNWGEFMIVFNCKPFKYSNQNKFVIKNTGNFSYSLSKIIYNPGTIETEPIIKILGSGDFLVNINNCKIFTIKDVENNVVINSVLKDCYKLYKNTEEVEKLMNDKMIGNFPLLNCGNNKIEILKGKSNSFERVEIFSNWRWI